MKKWFGLTIGFSFAAAFVCLTPATGQAIGNWTSPRSNMEHNGWQKAETIMSKENLSGKFKFLWKIQLGTAPTKDSPAYSEPLLVPRLINAKGFKDFALWADSENLYAVDSELGTVLWTKHYDRASSPCGPSNLSAVAEAPLVINFRARRPAGSPPPKPQPPMKVSERRVGISPGGGGFGLKGIFVLTSDGYLHEQVIATGADFAPPVKFLPGDAGIPLGLGLDGKTMYTATRSGCAGAENAVWAVDMSNAEYPVAGYKTGSVPPLVAMGPTIAENTAYVVTGPGASGQSGDVHANSVVALGPDAKVKDWYTPEGADRLQNVTPVALMQDGKNLLVAPGKDGSYVLLDAASLGGSDHKTPLASTPSLSEAKEDTIAALASWQDSGVTWVLASVPGPLSSSGRFPEGNGAAPHGSIVAFKLESTAGKMTLAPAWSSRDLVNPAPPVVANGLVIALSQGDASNHAVLYVLDAATGKELYSSGDDVKTYAHMAGVAVGDGHAFFVTHDNTLYSFGIGMEH
jgi:outer membrane protein assembly factor BamB